MPFDGRNYNKSSNGTSGGSAFDGFLTSQATHRFDVDGTRPTAQNSPLFGLDGAEWRGFFLALTGLLGGVLSLAAVVFAALGH